MQEALALFPELEKEQASQNASLRLRAAIGRSYHDIIRSMTGQMLHAPDFILFPKTDDDVTHILKQATDKSITINTFSGGSNVTGAYEIEETDQVVCSLNMKHMDMLLELDEVSQTATFQAGIFGPKLEEILNSKGFTMGHFPQSFEFSTLGGWLATRSAGQESGLYGKIEDIVLGIKVITPSGSMEDVDFPRHASGIDLYPLFIGSEGTLGIITQAKVRIHKLPESYSWKSALFKDYASGMEALKEMIQVGIHPSIVRLSDPMETKMLSLMSNSKKGPVQQFVQNIMKSYLVSKGFSKPCIMMMRFAIKSESSKTDMKVATRISKKHGAKMLPASVSETWEMNRFALPYLRDPLVQHRIMIDTFETVTYWQNIVPLYEHIQKALADHSDYFDKGGFLFCHVSHAYLTGASLYFTMLARQEKGNEVNQWLQLKEVVSNAVIEHGGAISHHHGVGKDHRKWYRQKLGESSRQLLSQIKGLLDPKRVLNPGKLFDEKKD